MIFETNLVDELRSRRKTIIEIVLIVTCIGLLLNLFSSFLYELLVVTKLPFTDTSSNVMFWGLAFVAFIGIALWYLLKGGHSDSVIFRILLPISTYEKRLQVKKIAGYAPTNYGDEIIAACLKVKPGAVGEIMSQLGLKSGKPNSEGNFFNVPVYEVVFTVILKMLKEYSKHTLTGLRYYHPCYSNTSWEHGKKEHPIDDVPIDRNRPYLPEKLDLPKGVTLHFPPGRIPEIHKIRIASPHCSLEFEILPYWTVITKKKALKTFLTATRGMEDLENIALLAVPVKISVSVSLRALWGKKADDYCKWMEGLLADAKNWLSWEVYQQDDLERMVVGINQKLMNLEVKQK